MSRHAKIEPGGHVTIDVDAWLELRTGGPIDDLTAALRRWAAPPCTDSTGGPVTNPGPEPWDWMAATRAMVFGPSLDAPFTPCPACAAHQIGAREEPCGCDGTPWIVCPVCGRRCDVELPTW